jgi:hypothetical protein
LPGVALALGHVETPMFQARVAAGDLPPVAQRLPKSPLIVNLADRKREVGRHGGEIVSLVSRARDIRYQSANSYARLIGYTQDLKLEPDLLEAVQNEGNRVFTLTLRDGHKWSDGHAFTSEDFRFYWEDVATNQELSPAGLPDFLLVEGKGPHFEAIDARTVRYSWHAPNPRFLPTLAQPRDPFIYRPAHYLKRMHARYAEKGPLNEAARKAKLKSWAGMFNRLDDMFENSNPDLPTLQPWKVTNTAPATRFVFERNPFYHRVDPAGQQLPYVDRLLFDVAAGGLMAAKANSGDADLLVRGLNMGDIPILKEGERAKGFKTLMWPYARGSEVALYPNLTVIDPVWRTLNRDVRFRRALSLGIDRRTLNNSLLFGLGTEGNNTVVPQSPLFEDRFRTSLGDLRSGRGLATPGRDRAHEAQRRGHPASAGRARTGNHRRDGRRQRARRGRPDPHRGVLARDRRQALCEASGPDRVAQQDLCRPHRHGGRAGPRPRPRHRSHAAGRARAASAGLLLVVEMGAAQGDEGRFGRGARHARGAAPPRALRGMGIGRGHGRAGACVAGDARQPRGEPLVHRHRWGRAQPVVARNGLRNVPVRAVYSVGADLDARRLQDGRVLLGRDALARGAPAVPDRQGLRSRRARPRADDPIPGRSRRHDGGDALHHLGARLLHHQAAARATS